MARVTSSDVKKAFENIQRVLKSAASPGGMRRDFIQAERTGIEDELVVLDIFAEERGYRKGFEAALRRTAERDRLSSEGGEEHDDSTMAGARAAVFLAFRRAGHQLLAEVLVKVFREYDYNVLRLLSEQDFMFIEHAVAAERAMRTLDGAVSGD